MSLSGDKDLEKQLAKLGNKLVDPTSVNTLLTHLGELEGCLFRMKQSPSKSMQSALSTSREALVCDKLLKHPSTDVRVAVASCISDITMIFAPDLPYEDEKMRDVFQLIVSSFENLSDKSSRSYAKRSHILKVVAGCKLSAVMLDMECDVLIVNMFKHLFKEIRDYHPENVFSAMETIMTHVIEQSVNISPELVSPILAAVKNDSKVLPIVKELAKSVLEKCELKLKPCLARVLKSLGVCSNDYCRIVSSICKGSGGYIDLNDVQLDAGHKLNTDQEVICSPKVAKKRGRDDNNIGGTSSKHQSKKKCTPASKKDVLSVTYSSSKLNPQASAAKTQPIVTHNNGAALEPKHWPPNISTKCMAPFRIKIADQSLTEEEEEEEEDEDFIMAIFGKTSLKDHSKKKCTPSKEEVISVTYTSSEMNPQASAETQATLTHNRGAALEPKYLPPNISTAMADEGDGLNFLMKAMASFPTKIADQSLREEDPTAMGTVYLTEKDNQELFLPFVQHFGWIIRPLPKDNPFLEEVKRGTYLGVARFVREVASLNSQNSDATSISSLQKYLKPMAVTMNLNEDFVSFISQYLEKRLAVQRAKNNAALVRKYQANLIEAEKAAAESEAEYNKPWQ